MKLKRKVKYFEKFFELLQKFQNVLMDKISNLTPKEKKLLDQIQKEEEEKQKSSVSYIIVSLKLL